MINNLFYLYSIIMYHHLQEESSAGTSSHLHQALHLHHGPEQHWVCAGRLHGRSRDAGRARPPLWPEQFHREHWQHESADSSNRGGPTLRSTALPVNTSATAPSPSALPLPLRCPCPCPCLCPSPSPYRPWKTSAGMCSGRAGAFLLASRLSEIQCCSHCYSSPQRCWDVHAGY